MTGFIVYKNKKIIAIKRKSLLSKAIGVMFKFKVSKANIFYFDKPQKVPLHMLFVFTSIDVFGLNEKDEVIEIKKNFKPFTFYTFKKDVSKIIEIGRNQINPKIKDKIKII
ncbi:MAG: DUF192 domain-containing protein [Candidatus Woesearchaeota archaeon]